MAAPVCLSALAHHGRRQLPRNAKSIEVDPAAFIATVEKDTRREDAKTMLDLMTRVSGYKPMMWGASIVGFGRYHYVYESGREGDSIVTGFSPRKTNLWSI